MIFRATVSNFLRSFFEKNGLVSGRMQIYSKREIVKGAAQTRSIHHQPSYVIMVITWPIGSSALATHELAARILDHTGERG